MTQVNIQDFFKTMVEMEASDLYLTVAKPPMYRVQGKIEARGDHAFSPDEVREIAHAFHTAKRPEEVFQVALTTPHEKADCDDDEEIEKQNSAIDRKPPVHADLR